MIILNYLLSLCDFDNNISISLQMEMLKEYGLNKVTKA